MGARMSLNGMFAAIWVAFVLVSCGQSTKTSEPAVVLDSALMIPDFTLSTIGDSLFTSRKSLETDGLVLIKYFSPDCPHCQDEATLYLSKKDSLQNIKTVWVAGNWNQLKMVKDFARDYQLAELSAIVVGKEPENALLVHYGFSGIPYSAVYKDNQLLKEYTGELDFGELISINNGTYVPAPKDSTTRQIQ